MKRLISLLAVALFGVALVGCSDNEETTPPTPPDPKPVDVYGWHMTKWEVGGDDTNFPKEVYIVFDEEKNFEMYQDVRLERVREDDGYLYFRRNFQETYR